MELHPAVRPGRVDQVGQCVSVTQWGFRHMRCSVLLFLLAAGAFLAAGAAAQTNLDVEEFRVYTEHPRLFLRPQRLRLLKRERERQSLRWQQFEALVRGNAQMPEPGLAYALYYAVSGDAAYGKRAVDWALSDAAVKEVRQIALVFDWCHDLLSASQNKQMAVRLRAAFSRPVAHAISAGPVLAAVASAEVNQDASEKFLRGYAATWRARMDCPGVDHEPITTLRRDYLPMLEILHAVRDNFNLDLRDSCPEYFRNLPARDLTSFYPAPYPAAENEYHVPAFTGNGQPNLDDAVYSRIAQMAMVAFDNNAQAYQFLQGWIIQDRFILRGTLGAPYEFLWANPYQPGLSYTNLPLVFHDPASGALFLRSTWDEDADWFGLVGSEVQFFEDGKVALLNMTPQPAEGGFEKSLRIGPASVVLGKKEMRFLVEDEMIFVIGLRSRAHYEVEVTDEEMCETDSDAAGTLALHFPKGRKAQIRMKEVAIASHGA